MSNGSDSAARMTAAARPVTIETIDGPREFLMTPFTDKDISEIDAWLRTRYIQNVADASVSPDVLKLAMDSAMAVTMLHPSGVAMLNTPEGMARVFWQSTRKRHPELTFEEVRPLLLNPQNVRSVSNNFGALNQIGDTKSKRQAGRKRRHKK